MKETPCHVKYKGRWYKARRVNHPDIIETYYMIAGHIILENEIKK